MQPYFTQNYGNPDSPHEAGRKAKEAVEAARKQVDELIGAHGSGLVLFTSGGTESNNMAFRILSDYPLAMNIISSETEHKSVLEPAKACRAAAKRFIKPGKKGYISVDDIDVANVPAFSLFSFMCMNNETGMVNDVYRIGEALKKHRDIDVFYHVDCVQAAGSVQINVADMNADMVSVSSHKLHGPKGVGCLWVSEHVLDRIGNDETIRLIRGGGQEFGLRAGTLNVPGIVGFGKAAEIAKSTLTEKNGLSIVYSELARHFCDELSRRCSDLGVKFIVNNFDAGHHCDKVLSVTFPNADSETIVLIASKNGLCISSGAACNAELSEPSYVLTNSGISEDLARNTVRVSFSYYSSYSDVTSGARILAETVNDVLRLNLTDAVE